jgi:hypothetical protein
VDEYEELNRWIQRAQIQRRQLRSGSKQERRLSRAIRGMEIHQLGRRIQRTRTELWKLPAGSDEGRKLAEAWNSGTTNTTLGCKRFVPPRWRAAHRRQSGRASQRLKRERRYTVRRAISRTPLPMPAYAKRLQRSKALWRGLRSYQGRRQGLPVSRTPRQVEAAVALGPLAAESRPPPLIFAGLTRTAPGGLLLRMERERAEQPATATSAPLALVEWRS